MLSKVTKVKFKESQHISRLWKVEGIQYFITELYFTLKDCSKWEEKLLNAHMYADHLDCPNSIRIDVEEGINKQVAFKDSKSLYNRWIK